MATLQWSTRVPADLNRLESLGRELRDHLTGAKRSVDEEIGAYPTPIPRCDAQFNHLYEQRLRLSAFLARLGGALDHGDAAGELVCAIVEFTTGASLGGGEDERSLRERLCAELARLDPTLDPGRPRRSSTPAGAAG